MWSFTEYKNTDVYRQPSSEVRNVCVFIMHTPQWIKFSSLMKGGPVTNKSARGTTAELKYGHQPTSELKTKNENVSIRLTTNF
jgi:hypothetical protein